MKLLLSAFILSITLCTAAPADPIEDANSYAVRIKSTVRYAFTVVVQLEETPLRVKTLEEMSLMLLSKG